MKYKLLIYPQFICFAFLMLISSSATAQILDMGTYTIKIGEEKTCSVDKSPSSAVNGTFKIEGKAVRKVSGSLKSCTVVGQNVGTSTVKWSGTIDGQEYDKIYWTINVTNNNSDDEDKLTITATPAGGTVNKGTKVNLKASNDNAIIWYTLDGSNPKDKGTAIPSDYNITINESCTLKAYATLSIYYSDIYSWNFIVKVDNSIELNEKNFPDNVFRSYISSCFDTNKDGRLSDDEISKIIGIHVYNKNISSLKGIEYLTELKELSCGYNQLTSLDLSKNTKLTSLSCSNNQLTSLDLSKNTKLTYLSCSNNQLKSLDLSKNTALTELYCYDNQLTSLDLSMNTKLTKVQCSNNKLTSLYVSKNTELTELQCVSNQLTSLDVSNNTALTVLNIHDNRLTSLDVSKNKVLNELYCSNNELTTLDVSNNTALATLTCGSKLTKLDVSKNKALIRLGCFGNQLTELDLSNNTALIRLNCRRNKIRGNKMDALINSLPINTSSKTYEMYVIDNQFNDEENVCTKAQVAAAKAKGWTPLYYNGTEYVEYEGSDDVPNLQFVSVKSTNTNLSNLTPNDKLVLEGAFKNTGASATISTRLHIFNQNKEGVAYSSSSSKEFKTNSQTTVKHEYALTNIPEGTYYATIQYFEEWDSKKWIYYTDRLISFTVKKSNVEYKDGDFFTIITEEGVDMSFQVLSATEKTCQVIGNKDGGMTNNEMIAYPAINTNYSGSVTIPSVANGYQVVKLGNTSFSCCNMKSLFISEGITSIGSEAFSICKNLSSLVIPRSVISIGPAIIEMCSNLKTIVSYIQAPDDIEDNVFYSEWKVFTSATLYVPKGTKSIYLARNGWKKFGTIVEFDPSTFNTTTLGINDVMVDNEKDVPVYDLFGRRLVQPRKGINIINRKKIITK